MIHLDIWMQCQSIECVVSAIDEIFQLRILPDLGQEFLKWIRKSYSNHKLLHIRIGINLDIAQSLLVLKSTWTDLLFFDVNMRK